MLDQAVEYLQLLRSAAGNFTSPRSRRSIEAAAIPAAEGREAGVAEQVSNVGQPQMTARKMMAYLLNTDAVEEIAEDHAVPLQTALERPDVRAQRVRDLSDRRASHGHEDPDRLFDFLGDGTIAGRHHPSNELPRVRSERHVRHWIAALHV